MTMFKYLLNNGSKSLKAAIIKLKLINKQYEFDYRNTVLDLCNNGSSEKTIREYEYLHDEYYLRGDE
jgi:hypothetical protein